MDIFKNIKEYIAHHNLINQHDTIIVGLSGGPDSVFLVHLLVKISKEIPLTLIIAHLNHEWRPEANAEEELCRTIAQKFNITFIASKLSELTNTFHFKYNGSREEYARKARRHFFQNLADQYNATSIALAHHLDDQEETFFIRLIRGSSLTGLTGIKPRNGLYIRPLLETNKAYILDWLNSHHINYAIDQSNLSDNYLRNRIRATVLPALRSCDNRFETNFLTTLRRLTDTELFLEKLTITTFSEITLQKNNQYHLDVQQLLDVEPILQNRLLIHWLIKEHVSFSPSESFLHEIMRFLKGNQGGSHTINQQWTLTKKQNVAFFTKI